MKAVVIVIVIFSTLCALLPVTYAKGTLRVSGHGYQPCDPTVQQYSGYFEIDAATNKNYFFWAFESRGNPLTDPVLLWMTGGPGCAGELGILIDNGPCHLKPTGEIYNNTYSWNNMATVIYIDQPSGVGFSYSDQAGVDTSEAEIGEDMFHFMQAFYKAFPKFQTTDLFVSGVSYGGHFVPATAHRIWQGNQAHEGIPIRLRGITIGDGLTDPYAQYPAYPKLAYDWCLTVKGTPCVTKQVAQQMNASVPQCLAMIKQCDSGSNNTNTCVNAMNFCNNALLSPYTATGLNPYDIRLTGDYNDSIVDVFMNRADVQKSLGVKPNTQWQECSTPAYNALMGDWMKSFQQTMPDMLNDGVRVLIYAGDMDFIVNWIGCKAWTLAMEWAHKADFNTAPDEPWYYGLVPAGYSNTVIGEVWLQFVVFFFASARCGTHCADGPTCEGPRIYATLHERHSFQLTINWAGR